MQHFISALCSIIPFAFLHSQVGFQTDYSLDTGGISSFSLVEVSNGDILLSGTSSSYINQQWEYDGYIIKTDSAGHLLWNTSIGGEHAQSAIDAIELPSGNIAFTGHAVIDNATTSRVLVGMLTGNGDVLWTKEYYLGGDCGGNSIVHTSDNHLLVGANVAGMAALLKIDLSGNIVWSKNYGGQGVYASLSRAIETADAGLAFTGYYSDVTTFSTIFWLVKTNAEGDTLFSRCATHGFFDEGLQIKETPEHDLIIGGNTQLLEEGSSFDLLLIKYSPAGALLWSKVYYTMQQEICYGLAITSDNHYVFGGPAMYPIEGGFNDYIVKTDTNGDSLWTNLYEHPSFPYAINITQSGDIMTAGSSEFGLNLTRVLADGANPCGSVSPGFSISLTPIQEFVSTIEVNSIDGEANDIELAVSSSTLTENTVCTTDVLEIKEKMLFSLFPNPTSGRFTINTSSSIKTGGLFITNSMGEIVYRKRFFNQTNQEINLTDFPVGIYFVTLFDGEKNHCQKIIVE